MDQKMHLICESVQEVTLAAWPVIWADNKYDQDSRVVLEVLRDWGEEFENWWIGHDEDWICEHDYIEEIWKYTDLKCKEYLRNICDKNDDDLFSRWSNLQEFTAISMDRAHYDNFFGYLMNERNMSREEAFLLIRQWADEFWFNHYNKSAFEIYKTGMSYYDFVDKFIEEKLASFKENK